MTLAITALFLTIACVMTVGDAATIEYESDFHSNVTLMCESSLLNLPQRGTPYLKYWILPDQSMLQWSHPAGDKYIIGQAPEFNLTIINVNEDDFGWYTCVILWDNYNYFLNKVNVGLNIDGVNYEVVLSMYRENALIGGIVVGAAFVLLAVGCALHCYFSKKQKDKKEKKAEQKVIKKLDKTVERYDEEVAKHDESVHSENKQNRANDQGHNREVKAFNVMDEYDNRAFVVENKALHDNSRANAPYRETDIDTAEKQTMPNIAHTDQHSRTAI